MRQSRTPRLIFGGFVLASGLWVVLHSIEKLGMFTPDFAYQSGVSDANYVRTLVCFQVIAGLGLIGFGIMLLKSYHENHNKNR